MKYIFFSFFLLGFTSCSLLNPLDKSSEGNNISPIDMGGVQVSGSGVSVSSNDGDVSIGADGKILITNDSGSISTREDGTSVISGDNTVTV